MKAPASPWMAPYQMVSYILKRCARSQDGPMDHTSIDGDMAAIEAPKRCEAWGITVLSWFDVM